jgi:putative SOS response-associated peptidase YedK
LGELIYRKGHPALLPTHHGQSRVEEAWLNSDLIDVGQISQMLKPYPSENMEEWRVGDEARNPKNDYPEVMKPMVSSEEA